MQPRVNRSKKERIDPGGLCMGKSVIRGAKPLENAYFSPTNAVMCVCVFLFCRGAGVQPERTRERERVARFVLAHLFPGATNLTC
jgi:hypothetical protein